jgi:hypothetical protein
LSHSKKFHFRTGGAARPLGIDWLRFRREHEAKGCFFVKSRISEARKMGVQMNTRHNYFPLMFYGDLAPQRTYFFFFFLAAFFFVAIEFLLGVIPASAFFREAVSHS